jgi:hypothetical protein
LLKNEIQRCGYANKTCSISYNILNYFSVSEFFNCLVVRAESCFHNIDPPAKKEQATKSKASSMASKLHKMFDAVEEMGAWTEVAGVTAALLPEDFH